MAVHPRSRPPSPRPGLLSRTRSGDYLRGVHQGRATAAGTAAAAARGQGLAPDFHAPAWEGGPLLSGLGIGTYLGQSDEATDAGYEATIAAALAAGITHVDTAINYRAQRSERAIGALLGRLLGGGELRREELLIATKGGFVPRDADTPEKGGQALLAGVPPEEVIEGSHCLHPAWLQRMLALSRKNLGLSTIDVYYLHNPETQLGHVARPVFYERLRRAFAALESARAAGEIAWYGTATWSGYLRPLDDPAALDMERVLGVARAVGGEQHGLRFVQLPVNVAQPEALREPTQRVGGEPVTALEAARRLGLASVASGALAQGKLARAPVPAALDPEGQLSPAQRALRFARSCGVASALVGCARLNHLAEDLGAGRLPRLSADALRAALEA